MSADLPAQLLRRQDESADEDFYLEPRLVAHIDDAAIEALGQFFREHIPDGAAVLDLMSAYLSHLPADVRQRCRSVVGLGMNAEEMAANAQLSKYVVHNLNREPTLPFEDASFDAAVCTVSVQYLLHGTGVFGEVGRVLRPGAPFMVSFSNRCFSTKAVAAGLYANDQQHAALVGLYFERSGCWQDISVADISPNPGVTDPMYVVWARRA